MDDLKFLKDLIKPIAQYKSVKPYRSVFQAISNTYYHENFHSDILAFYLSYNIPKRIFIDWLNENIESDKEKISYEDYKNGEVLREKNRIDITLFNKDKNRAIIIENKSNSAKDQYKQIYRYYEILEKKKIKVEQICYINKNSLKEPSFNGYSNEEEKSIRNILTITQLLGSKSLSTDVIQKVIESTDDIRLKALSLELIELFNYLINGGINMDNLEELVEKLSENDNKKSLDKIIEAYRDIPIYLAKKYKNYIDDKSTEFTIWIYKEKCLVIDNISLKDNDKRFAIDIWFSTKDVNISYIVRDGDNNDVEDFKNQFGNKLLFKNEKEDGRYRLYLDNPLDDKSITSKIDKILEIIKK